MQKDFFRHGTVRFSLSGAQTSWYGFTTSAFINGYTLNTVISQFAAWRSGVAGCFLNERLFGNESSFYTFESRKAKSQ